MLFGKQQYSTFFGDKHIKHVLETSLKGKYKNIFEIPVLGKFLFFRRYRKFCYKSLF